MNIPVKILDPYRHESAYGKLALMALCSIFLIAAIAKQLPANAADKSAVVSLADLDLSTEKGMQAARDRLHATARRLCGRVVNPWALSHQADYVRCVNDAMSAAVAQLQGPLLVASPQSHAQGVSTR